MAGDRLIDRLRVAVGDAHVLVEERDVRPYAVDMRKRWFGRPLAVVRPRTTAEVAAVVRGLSLIHI